MNKNHIRKLLACVLVLSVCLTYSLGTALATEPTTSKTTTGNATFADPTVETKTTKDSATDSQGYTTDTTKIDKNWNGETTTDDEQSGKVTTNAINGEEDTKLVDTTSKYGTLSGSGSSKGNQTTTETTVTDTPIEVKGSEAANIGISTKSEPITLTVEPADGKNTDEESGSVHAWLTPTSDIVPAWVGTITGASIAWNDSSSSNVSNVVINITATSTTSGEGTDAVTTKNYTREDVSALSTVKYVYTYTLNADGNITSYTQETTETKSIASYTTTLPKYAEIFAGNSGTTAFELPDKSKINCETLKYYDGTEDIKEGQLLGEIYDSANKLVGYVRITYADGNPVNYEAFMGSDVTTATSVESLAGGLRKYITTKTTHTETSGTIVSKSVTDGTRTATAKMEGIQGIINTASVTTYEPKRKSPYSTSTDYGSDLIFKDTFSGGTKYTDGYETGNLYWFDKVGYGLGSKLLVKTSKMNGINAHQFILTDSSDKASENKKLYYVYCADLAVDPQDNAIYNMQRIEDADYYKNSGVINKTASDAEQQKQLALIRNQIRAIVLNGYWGTETNAAGSIENFRKMLENKLVKSTDSKGNKTYYNVNDITEGMALTATQAAIWYYGNSDSNSESGQMIDDFVSDKSNVDNKEIKKELTKAIYKYLINKDDATGLPAENGTGLKPQKATADNTLLTKEDFAKSVTLTIGDRTADGKYLTDIDITMEKITSGGLTLSIKVDTNPLGEYDLSTTAYSNGAYHIEGLKLPNNATITLSFDGTQELKNGVYLFSSYKKGTKDNNPVTVSQTFIGAGQATQNINLSTSFNFTVTDPMFKLTSTDETSSAETLAWDGSYTISVHHHPTGTTDDEGDEDEDKNDDGEENGGDDETVGGEVSGDKGDKGSGNDSTNGASADVDVPKTGDANRDLLMWFALVGGSAAGLLALLQRKRKQNAR